MKSSPLIEKLQANLTFDPAALLPGASPKSPGLKATVSPFHSPPPTPGSPGVRSRPSEAEEVPVSFDQPPEGSHLPCYNKVRTRGSIKRRPPSRRFRRSQSDCGDLGDFRATESSQENGAREENGDEVFAPKSQAPGSPPSRGGAGESGALVSKPPLRRTVSSSEKQDRAGWSSEGPSGGPARVGTPEEAEGASAPPSEAKASGEEAELGKSAEAKQGDKQDGPRLQSQDAKPEEAIQEEETAQAPARETEGGSGPTQEEGKEKREQGGSSRLQPQDAPGHTGAQQ